MKAILFFLLCLPAYAASPPMPPIPTVKRPAPLLSPKAASQPKVVAMLKFTPAGTASAYAVPGWAPLAVTVKNDTPDFFGDIADMTKIQAIQRVGNGIRIEFTGHVTAPGPWTFAADFPPYVSEQPLTLVWMHSAEQRQTFRVFRAVEYDPPAASGMRIAGAVAKVRTNWDLKGVWYYSRGDEAGLEKHP